MRDLQADIAEDAATHCVFTWAGSTYYCVPNPDQREVVISADGNPVTVAVSLLVEKAHFESGIVPQSGQRITHNSRNYKVAKVEDLIGAAAWLHCIDAHK
jgi:hypothetical protein